MTHGHRWFLARAGEPPGRLRHRWVAPCSTAGSPRGSALPARGSVTLIEPQAALTSRFTALGVGAAAEAGALPADAAPAVVVVAIKPQQMDAALPGYARFVRPGTVFLSIAAGKTIGNFEAVLGAEAAIVRGRARETEALRSRQKQAVAALDLLQIVEDRQAPGPAPASEIGERERRAHAILVAHDRADDVAEGLLVTEQEARPLLALERDGPVAQPSEPGEGLVVRGSELSGNPRELRRRDDRRHHEGSGGQGAGLGEHVVSQQDPGLVAREHPEAAVTRTNAHRQAIGVRVIGQEEVRSHLFRESDREVEGAGLLGVREPDRRKLGVGLVLLRHGVHISKTSLREGLRRPLPADSVQGGVDDPEVGSGPGMPP